MTRRATLLALSALGASYRFFLKGQAVGPASLMDFEPLAKQVISPMAFEYIASGAADEITLRANREAWNKISLKPRVLVDVSRIDTKQTLLGQELAFPILLAPTATHKLVHPQGELATTRAASASNITFVVSTLSSVTIEEISKAANSTLWFQLYVQKDRSITRELMKRSEVAGCRAFCITVDTPVRGVRDHDVRAGYHLPPGVQFANIETRPGELGPQVLNASLTWSDIDWVRSQTRLPVLLKGILSAEDASTAAKEGFAGVIVSNHGARNLDTTPATVEALPLVVDKVNGQIPVLVDGGIRRGTDVLKAIALGATAVLIGRPYLYGLGYRGEEGVSQVVRMLRTEFQAAMALTGQTSIAGINRSILWS